MAIEVRFFASLRERMGRAGERINAREGMTVQDVWSSVAGAQPLDANMLTAVNLEYVGCDHIVSDGDEVAFFPPVTGG